MPRPGSLLLVLSALLGGCSAPPEPPQRAPEGPSEPSEVAFQAVDAGTGASLMDPELTVRYLVRAPITLDATAVEQVAAAEPYRIEHPVSTAELVVEVRLEAASYHPLDTVLSVARGEVAGPLTLRLTRRLDRMAEGGPPAGGILPGTGAGPAGESRPAGTAASAGTTPGAAAFDETAFRSALQAGNRAFASGDWVGTISAFQRLPEPSGANAETERQYQEALVRYGVAHMNRSEFGSALEVLEGAAARPDAGPGAFLRLAQAQCAVGRSEEGRGTLAQLERSASRMTPQNQALTRPLVVYYRGVCAQGEFERAPDTRERVRSGAAAIREFEAFKAAAAAVSPQPAEVQEALADADRRMAVIRQGIRG